MVAALQHVMPPWRVEEPAPDLTRRQILIGVISSLIATIVFLILLQPLFGFLWRFVLSNVGFLNDLACRNAAVDGNETYSFLLFTFANMLILAFAVTLGVVIYMRDRPSARREMRFVEWKLFRRVHVSLMLVLTLLVVAGQYKHFLVMALRTSFHQRLTVLDPKISDQEHKELLAAWASMRNENDYRHIVDDMEAKAPTAT